MTDLALDSAEEGDIGHISGLLRRAQEKLEAAGSAQVLSVLDAEAVARHVRSGQAHVLRSGREIIGVAFVEPVTAETLPALQRWGIEDSGRAVWHLQSLAVKPESRGCGLGMRLLDGIKGFVGARGPALIVLDCWAGNYRLREYYSQAGFELHGVFPSRTGDYEVAVFTWRS